MQRLTRSTAQVLSIMLENSTRWVYGYDLIQTAQISSGTLYPILSRLLDDEWVEARWQESPHPGRPPRHQYRLSTKGRALARSALRESQAPWISSLRTQG